MMNWLRRLNPFRLRRRKSQLRKFVVWTARISVVLLLLDTIYLFSIWPNWSDYGRGTIQKTGFIKRYEAKRSENRSLPVLRWRPVPLNWIPRHVQKAVLVAEDSRFYQHSGVDLKAFKQAMDYNLEHLKFKYGGSTISQQTIKNMFLSSSRNPLRKWHELILTLGMEMSISKKRILEIYLNVAEYGQGIYGVEAAAQYYWGISALTLSSYQAAQLAATLPSPIKHNPNTRTRRFTRRSHRIFNLIKTISR